MISFISVKERATEPENQYDLTLLTCGFNDHKEIKFTNLVPLPTPVDSSRVARYLDLKFCEIDVDLFRTERAESPF